MAKESDEFDKVIKAKCKKLGYRTDIMCKEILSPFTFTAKENAIRNKPLPTFSQRLSHKHKGAK